jgi:hypothetical protein
MARRKIPDPLTRRLLVEGALEPSRARTIAEAYLSEGRLVESIAFLAKAEDRDALARLRDEAVATGDVFLLREAAAALGEEIDAARWRATAEQAVSLGKEQYSAEARRQAAAQER